MGSRSPHAAKAPFGEVLVILQLRVGPHHAVGDHGVVMVTSMVKITDMLALATSKRHSFYQ